MNINQYNALFTGQGAQYAGMFDEFSNEPMALEIFADASNILSYDLLETSRDEEKIYLTQYSQPLNFVYEYLQFILYQQNTSRKPKNMIGHSMGEFAALACAGVVDFETGLRLIKKRGELMAQVAPDYLMVSVIGIEYAEVEQLLTHYTEKEHKESYISNCNGKEQTIVTIPKDGLKAFETTAKEVNEKVRIMALKLPYPFHTRYMKPFADKLVKVLEDVDFHEPKVDIILNVTGKPFQARNSEILKKYMAEQMYMPVQFTKCMRQAYLTGVNNWVEFGPKPLLSKMVAREFDGANTLLAVKHNLQRMKESSETTEEGKEDSLFNAIGLYLKLLTSRRNLPHCTETSKITAKYRLLRKLYLSLEKEGTHIDEAAQGVFARLTFLEAMQLKGYSKQECEDMLKQYS